MLSSLVVAALLAASPSLAIPADIFERQASCNRDNLFRCFTASQGAASPFCASYAPATVTASTTVTVNTATLTIPVTSPVTAFVTSTTTFTFTETLQTTLTIPVEDTITVTVTGTPQTTGSLLDKRQASVLGPPCLTEAGAKSTSYPASRISSACACLFPQSTVTVIPTAFGTATAQPVVTVTVTETVPATAIIAVTTTSTHYTYSYSTSVATATAIPPPAILTYSRAAGPGASCFYNRYTDGKEVDNSPTNDYALGISQCKDFCTGNTDCKFFFYFRYDPARSRGLDIGYCLVDSLPYDSAFLECGYPSQKYIGYNKKV